MKLNSGPPKRPLIVRPGADQLRALVGERTASELAKITGYAESYVVQMLRGYSPVTDGFVEKLRGTR